VSVSASAKEPGKKFPIANNFISSVRYLCPQPTQVPTSFPSEAPTSPPTSPVSCTNCFLCQELIFLCSSETKQEELLQHYVSSTYFISLQLTSYLAHFFTLHPPNLNWRSIQGSNSKAC
jgi:hypothetical protein